MRYLKFISSIFFIIGILLLNTISTQAHECGPFELTMNAGDTTQWQITADLIEDETTYTPLETGDPNIATIEPTEQFKAHDGVFTVTAIGEGITSFSVKWDYAPTQRSDTCECIVTVNPATTDIKDIIFNDDSSVSPFNNPSTYGNKTDQSQGGDLNDTACCDICPITDTASLITSGGLKNDTPDPIILHNGEFVMSVTDLRIPGRGFDWTFSRTYKSRITYDGPLGNNWDFNYNSRIVVITEDNQGSIPTNLFTPVFSGSFIKLGSVIVMDGHGRSDLYGLQPGGTYSTPLGSYTRLTKNNDGSFTLRDRHGNKKLYTKNGFLVNLEDRHGNIMTFTRDATGKLLEVADTLGRKITYSYNTDGRLTEVKDFFNRSLKFGYDGNGDLISATSPAVTGTPNGNDYPDGKTTKYIYSSGFQNKKLNHNLLSITAPNEVATDGNPCTINVYEIDFNSYAFDRVVKQTYGGTNASGIKAGGDILYQYDELTKNPSHANDPVNRVTVIDRNGNKTIYEHNKLGNAVSIKEYTKGLRTGEPEYYETSFEYNEDGERVKSQLSAGNMVDNLYATEKPGSVDYKKSRFKHGNLLENKQTPDNSRGGDQKSLIPTFIYEPIYNYVRKQTDPRGNDSSYIPPNGGMQSAERYTTTYYFDYQEGNNLDALATVMGISSADVQTLLDAAGIKLGLGDLNRDGITNDVSGDIVKLVRPTVKLPGNSNQAKREGDTTQEIVELFVYNQYGQITSKRDAEENVTKYDYYPENDPDGDGKDTIKDKGKGHFGYLKKVVTDATPSPKRDSGTNPKPAKIETKYFYDPAGNIIKEINGRGIATEYSVNELNQRMRIIRATKVPKDKRKRTLKAFRYITNFMYDYNNNIIKKEVENRDSNNISLAGDFVKYTYAYDILNHLIKETQEVGNAETLITEYRYDANDNRIKIIQPEGNFQDTVYDERDLKFHTTNECGCSGGSPHTTYNYDKNGNILSVIDGEDNNGDGKNDSTQYEYDGFNRLTKIIDPLGNVIQHVYDPVNNIIKVSRSGVYGGSSPKDNSGAGNVLLSQTEYSFDELNRMFQQDKLLFISSGVITQRPPVLKDGPLGISNDGHVITQFEYDRKGRKTFIVEDDGDVFEYQYDGADRKIFYIDPEGNRIDYTYDENNNITKIVETEVTQKGNKPSLTEQFTTLYLYDALDRLVRTTDNIGQTTRYVYDSRNNLILTSDAQGKKIKDNEGLFSGQINSDGNTVNYYYDGVNRKIQEVKDIRIGGQGGGVIDTTNPSNPDGMVTIAYEYDKNSRLISLTDDKGNTTHYEYDDSNRKTRQINADGTTKKFEYDQDNNLIKMVDENGSIIRFKYDALNRMTQKLITRMSGTTGTTRQEFEYDGISRITRSFDNNDPGDKADDATVTYAYDSLNRCIEEVQNGQAISNQWDGDNKRLLLIYPNGRKLRTFYDKLDRINKIKELGNNINIVDYDYIGPSRVIEMTYRNGIRLSYLDDNRVKDIGYDKARRPIRRRYLTTDNTLIAGFEYDYDRMNNKLLEVRLHEFSGQTNTGDVYDYDSLYRLTTFQRNVIDPRKSSLNPIAKQENTLNKNQTSYMFDGAGNWTNLMIGKKSYKNKVNKMNEYVMFKNHNQSHDKNGNRIDSGMYLYKYDFANRLSKVIQKTDNSVIAVYTYDVHNRRTARFVTNTADFNTSVKYLYDGWRGIEEQTDSTTQQYVYGAWIDELLTMDKDNNGNGIIDETFFYHCDGRNSISTITDTSGNVIERYTYDAYGQPFFYDSSRSLIFSSSISNPYLFTGRHYDPELDNYYYRARYHNPSSGRFMQRDILNMWYDKFNLGNGYTYVGNNPMNWVDPMGLKRVSMLFYHEDLDWAAKFVGWFNGSSFSNARDILNQVSAGLERPIDPNGRCKDCLASIELVAHGAPGGAFLNLDGNGADWVAVDPNKKSIMFAGGTEALFSGLRQYMCVNSIIILNMCNAGKGRNGDTLLQGLANITGADVKGPTEEVKKIPLSSDPTPTNVAHPEPSKAIHPPDMHTTDIAPVSQSTVTR